MVLKNTRLIIRGLSAGQNPIAVLSFASLETFPSMPSCLVPDFAALPTPPVFGSCWQVRVCAQVPALHAQQLLWHGAPILFQLFCTIFSLISPQNHVKLADHARDAFGRSSSCPISLCCSLIWGCFVAAACNYYSNIVSKVKGSLPG
jgi:hypothetical protein